jgi:osmoprotectant transport system permease protein
VRPAAHLALAVALAVAATGCARRTDVRIGSKKFTESVILGEIATQLLASRGIPARHQRELGGTRILWDALRAGEIDVYPEYTGTLRQEILTGAADADDAALARALYAEGIALSPSLGFADSYAIGMRADTAAHLHIVTLSDLAAHRELVLGLSHEFLDRQDGWPALRDRYGFAPHEVRGLDHDVAYRALASGAVAATDLYSTDAEIAHYGLRVLVDDLHHFPGYRAVLLVRADLARRQPAAVQALPALAGRISEAEMIAMNARAQLDHVPESRIAADFLAARLGVRVARTGEDSLLRRLWARTREHLALVAISLLAALVVAIPLGIVSARRPVAGQLLLGAVGVIQTIPSLALLVLMIPLLGIGSLPAVAAMFLYSLLPIVRNTAAGLTDIPTPLRESAAALGLPPGARLRLIELPMASRSILAGIKTSAVLNVGTATLGALIGAGGYGQPILTGIRMDNVPLILEGAVPAALLALLVQGLFELFERALVPRGLRLRGGE